MTLRDRRDHRAGIVRYFCSCGFIVSARSAFAALLAYQDHEKYCHSTDPRD